MKIDIIGSGSSGNCIVLDDEVMIDAGVPYKQMGNATKLMCVLLTHEHGDHFNAATIRKLTVNTTAQFVCGPFLSEKLKEIGVPDDRISVVDPGQPFRYWIWTFVAVNLYHDVPNYGWRIQGALHKHFHATDTATLEGITAIDYDSATIECNHHLPTAIKLIEQAEADGEYTHLKGAINSHLSVDKAIEFVKANRIKKFYPCHIGNSTKKEVIEALEKAFADRKEILCFKNSSSSEI